MRTCRVEVAIAAKLIATGIVSWRLVRRVEASTLADLQHDAGQCLNQTAPSIRR